MPRSPHAVELVSQPDRSRRRRGTPRVVHQPLGLAEYRREVVRLGGYVGWSEPDVARFAERLTGCSWRDCQAAELGNVARSYAEIATRIRARLSTQRGGLTPC
jgi:hypothetical protein